MAVAAARAVLAKRREELLRGEPGPPLGGAGVCVGGRRLAAKPAAPGQRHRRHRAHQLRPGAVGGGGARGGGAGRLGYSNRELDLATGARGSCHDHVEAVRRERTGAEAAMAVNNCGGKTLAAERSRVTTTRRCTRHPP